MTTPQNPEREGGPLLKTYRRAKAKLSGLMGGGKHDIETHTPQKDPADSGHDWKSKPAEEVSQADEVRSQEERKEIYDGDGVMPSDNRRAEREPSSKSGREAPSQDGPGEDDGGPRGQVEVPSGDPKRPVGAENPAAPAADEVERHGMATMQEDEDGKVPSEGLGIDDGPRVKYPSDTGA
ncbi:hypothetical protein [Parvularcula oceani]|uniref:hypothetical protein n=1 Tax=Parvularcula oceani TaxID=1247963 RepID=UPI0012DFB699|nr:hypothetical protein [Parvularcula oceani]